MPKTLNLPSSLRDAIRYFAEPDVALTFLASLRWPQGVTCPACEAKNPMFLKTRRIWKCRDCGRQFSVKLGTIFEDSPIGLDRWLPALWMLANSKNGISSYELARGLGVTQKTAWFMLHRIRLAMESRTFKKMRGNVEADESFLGGAAKFMHKDKKKRVVRGTGGMDKVAVFGLLERGKEKKLSRVAASVVSRIRKKELQKEIREKVKAGSALHTDAFWSYRGLEADYLHGVIDHAVGYVRGKIHTNGLENFWSLLKRTIKGTYVSVDPFHVPAYLAEQVHRFNHRGLNDRGRFVDVLRSIIGKRLTYRDLTGADLSPATT
jgi:transposase-like protein